MTGKACKTTSWNVPKWERERNWGRMLGRYANRQKHRKTNWGADQQSNRQSNINIDRERVKESDTKRHTYQTQTDRETVRQTKHRQHYSFPSLLIYGFTINSLFALATYLSQPRLWVLRKGQTVFCLHTLIQMNTQTSTNTWKCRKRLKTHYLFVCFSFIKNAVLMKTPVFISD